MTRHGMLSSGLAGASLLLAGVAFAQMGMGSPSTPSQNPTADPNSPQAQMAQMNGRNNQAQPSIQDRMFVGSAIQSSMGDVELGKLALEKSGNDQVKQFAQRMIDDHTKLIDQMTPLAKRVEIPVPGKISKKDRKTIAKLQTLSGAQFDQAFLQQTVKEDTHDLRDFQEEVSVAGNPAIKNAASQAAQVVNQHLQMAQQLAQNQNITVSSR